MIKPAMLAYAAHFTTRIAPRLMQVKRRTWIGLGLGTLVLFGLLLWAFIALAAWLFGLVSNWSGDPRQAAESHYRAAVEQVEAVAPAVVAPLRGVLEPLFPDAVPSRDVSGQDLGPVARYPGMVRSQWLRDGGLARVQYQGAVDYAAVVRHYAEGFAGQGFAHEVQAASPKHEVHRFTKGPDSYRVEIRGEPGGRVSASIEEQSS